MKKVNIVIGRFQPFTRGHYACVEAAMKQKSLPTVICIIDVPEDKVDERHPFSSDMLTDLYGEFFSQDEKIAGVVPVKSADIVKIAEELKGHGFQIGSWTCGTDRIDAYTRMSTKYKEQANLADDFEMIEVYRTDDDVSATKARQALLDDDKKAFYSMVPKVSMSTRMRINLFDHLKKQIDKVHKK